MATVQDRSGSGFWVLETDKGGVDGPLGSAELHTDPAGAPSLYFGLFDWKVTDQAVTIHPRAVYTSKTGKEFIGGIPPVEQ
jgi:hypothetical protein